jgi:hypothetical protein
MNVISKDITATAGFDPIVWKEELLTLNPWAHGLTIEESNSEFAAARQKATLARHGEGEAAWNNWAKRMLALKDALEAAGQWTVTRGRYPWQPPEAKNEVSKVWLLLASPVFSTKGLRYRFETSVSFVSFLFPFDAWFEGATFDDVADFTGATFSGGAWFEQATFRVASFQQATFSAGARFWRATFNGMARFEQATFNGEARFVYATFGRPTSFRGVRFNSDVDFGQAKFKEAVAFADSFFMQAANFDSVDSAAAFTLANASFRQVPGFFSATFKGTLRLDNVATPRYPWLGYTTDKDATARFRELRRQAMEAQDRERELEFFAQEIRTGRFHSKGLPSWVPKVWSWRFWFGLGFGALSDFGRSLWRPFLSWVALMLLCAVFFLGERDDTSAARNALAPTGFFGTVTAYVTTTHDALSNPPACLVKGRKPFASTNAVTEAFLLSLKNALVLNIGSTESARRALGCLYGLEQDGDPQYVSVPTFVSVVSTAQALASGLLIFLFVLAVRNLLRLK